MWNFQLTKLFRNAPFLTSLKMSRFLCFASFSFDFDAVLTVHLRGAFFLSRLDLPEKYARKSGVGKPRLAVRRSRPILCGTISKSVPVP